VVGDLREGAELAVDLEGIGAQRVGPPELPRVLRPPVRVPALLPGPPPLVRESHLLALADRGARVAEAVGRARESSAAPAAGAGR